MTQKSWIGLTGCDRSLLLDSLSLLRKTLRVNPSKIDALVVKLVHSDPHPSITVGVHGGQVQWVKGNPFPVRVLDYDNDYGDAPDLDEHGRRCRCSVEPADSSRLKGQHRR